MADDFARIQSNVQKLVDLDAPEADIDEYLADEGFTPETFRAKVLKPKPMELPEDRIAANLPGFIPEGIRKNLANAKGALDTSVDAIGNIVTMGWGDEVSALGRAAGAKLAGNDQDFWKIYDDRLGKVRTETDQMAERHPVASGVGSVAGFAGSLGMAPGALASITKAVTPTATKTVPKTFIRKLDENIQAGLVSGGIAGAGGAEKSEDRLTGAINGAAFGAGVGATLPYALQLVGKGAGSVRNMLGLADQERIAEQLVLRKLQQDKARLGRDPSAPPPTAPQPNTSFFGFPQSRPKTEDLVNLDLVERRVKEMQGNTLDGGASLLDIGPQTQRLGRTVETGPGSGSSEITDFLNSRQEYQGTRIQQGVEKALGNDSDAAKVIQTLEDTRKAEATPFYEKAFERSFNWSPRLDDFLGDPVAQKAMQKGLRIQRLESVADGRKFDPMDYGIASFNEAGDPVLSGKPNMRLLDAVKKGLDDTLETYRDKTTGRLVLDGEGRAIDQFRRKYVEELDRINPTYGLARELWAGPTRSRDAVLAGRDFMKGDIEDIDPKKMSPVDLDFFKVGVAREMRSMIEKTRDGYDKVAKLWGSPDMRNRLERILGTGEYHAFRAQMEAEAAMFQSRRVATGNSATKRIEADLDEANGLSTGWLGDVASAALGGPKAVALSALSKVANRHRGLSEEAGADIATMLTTTPYTRGGEDFAKVIDRLRSRQGKNQSVAKNADLFTDRAVRAAANVGGQPMSLLGPVEAPEPFRSYGILQYFGNTPSSRPAGLLE